MSSLRFHQEEQNLLDTDYVRIYLHRLPGDFIGEYNTYSSTRLFMLEYGSIHSVSKYKQFTIDKDQSLIMSPFSKIELTVLRPAKAIVFEFKNELIEHVAYKLSVKSHQLQQVQKGGVVLLNNADSKVNESLKELLLMGKEQNRADSFLIDLAIQKLVYHLLGYRSAGNAILSQIHNPMEHVLSFIRTNPGQVFSIKELADKLGMSESNFSHTFKSYTSMTPTQYIQQLKMNEAARLLESKSVTETAYELGFDTPSYFIKLFKQAYGLTPKQFQLKVL